MIAQASTAERLSDAIAPKARAKTGMYERTVRKRRAIQYASGTRAAVTTPNSIACSAVPCGRLKSDREDTSEASAFNSNPGIWRAVERSRLKKNCTKPTNTITIAQIIIQRTRRSISSSDRRPSIATRATPMSPNIARIARSDVVASRGVSTLILPSVQLSSTTPR